MPPRGTGRPRRESFTQDVYLTESAQPARVDREKGIIYGVKILGKHSKNENGMREYADEVLQHAPEIYEGMQTNYDHPELSQARADRKFDDAAGVLRNVQLRDGEPYGDLHLLVSDPKAQKLLEAAEKMPDRFALSHNADGEVVRSPDGRSIVRKLHRVRSVDVVHRGGTCNTLFESDQSNDTGFGRFFHLQGPPMKTIKLSALLEAEDSKSMLNKFEEGYKAGMREDDTETSGASPMQAMEDDEVQVPDEDGDGNGLILALLACVMKLLGKSAATQERMRESFGKVKKTLESKFGPDAVQGEHKTEPADAFDASGSPGPGGAKGPGAVTQNRDEPYQESLKQLGGELKTLILESIKPIKADIDSIKSERQKSDARTAIVTLIESKNREPDEVLVKAALALSNDSERVRLIESFPEKQRPQSGRRPAESRSILESDSGRQAKIPDDPKEFANSLRGGGRSRVALASAD